MTCENCGQPAGPRFCGACGQALEHRRFPFIALIRELFEEALSLDGRTIRTLRTLAHPGRLTRLYLDGKRAPFLTPLRLYLLASVILFSSAFALEPPAANAVNFSVGNQLLTEDPPVRGRPNLTFLGRNTRTEQWLMSTYAENFARLRAMPAQDAINTIFRGMRNVLPIAFIAFLPLFALALKVLYARSHVLYVDHLIFAAHFQAALYLAFATGWLFASIADLSMVLTMLMQFGVFMLMMTVYLGIALRHVHRQSRVMTAAKTFAMLFAYLYTLQAAVGPAMVWVISRI